MDFLRIGMARLVSCGLLVASSGIQRFGLLCFRLGAARRRSLTVPACCLLHLVRVVVPPAVLAKEDIKLGLLRFRASVPMGMLLANVVAVAEVVVPTLCQRKLDRTDLWRARFMLDFLFAPVSSPTEDMDDTLPSKETPEAFRGKTRSNAARLLTDSVIGIQVVVDMV